MPYCTPSTWYMPTAASLRSPIHGSTSARDVPHQPGVDLLDEAAAAPRLEQVGRVAGLQAWGDRRLERLVLVAR